MSAAGKVLGMIRRGVLVGSKLTSGALRQLQARVDGTIVDDVELFEPYGMASVAPVGSHVLIIHVGGDESHPIAVATASTAHRPSDLTAGQYAIYDSTGKVVKLSSSGIQLGTGASLGVARVGDSVSVTIPTGTVAVGFSGGAAVMNPAPITLTGTITEGSTTVKAVD